MGVSFEVVVPEVEELTTGDPEATVLENARRKARAGKEMLVRGLQPPKLAGAVSGDAAGAEETLVLGVDTEVLLDGRLLGKAGTEEEARERLAALSGRTHDVLSGAVVMGGGAERSGVAKSRVTFRELAPDLLETYLTSGEWRDRAGAYAVQGLGSSLVEGVDGDLSNVIGLPVALLLDLVPDLLDTAGDSRY